MAKLTARARKKIPSGSFALPGRSGSQVSEHGKEAHASLKSQTNLWKIT